MPPARLEKRTLKPQAGTAGARRRHAAASSAASRSSALRLSDQPEALAFVDSLRGTLTGDRAALEKNYKLRLSGNEERWMLDLLPNDQRIAAFVLRITFGGTGNRVEWIQLPAGRRRPLGDDHRTAGEK